MYTKLIIDQQKLRGEVRKKKSGDPIFIFFIYFFLICENGLKHFGK